MEVGHSGRLLRGAGSIGWGRGGSTAEEGGLGRWGVSYLNNEEGL